MSDRLSQLQPDSAGRPMHSPLHFSPEAPAGQMLEDASEREGGLDRRRRERRGPGATDRPLPGACFRVKTPG